jgi:methylated-DNA-protein-cysteine methyltransferase-like protein
MKKQKSDKTLDFFDNVYAIVRLIPKGRVTSYGAIAKALGVGGSSRMVGWAMNDSHKLGDVPAHRVVNRNGLLTGKMHFLSPTYMEELLFLEGITVKNDKIVDFPNYFWNPMDEIEF